MGASNSINILEKSNGIFEINVDGYPNYPIAYLRLCLNLDTNKYCIAEDCDVEKKFTGHRKIIVVGMRLPEDGKRPAGIYEQSFYQSSGLNSIESLEKFFKTKLIIKKDDKESADIWIPFMGFGYQETKTEEDYYKFKLLKKNFGCEKKDANCLYGRFGQYNPNLMQISYCLGGIFWENNFDNKKFDLVKMPIIDSNLKKLACFYTPQIKTFKTNIQCYEYLNDYIGPAMIYNYSPELLAYKNKYMDPTIKADWRIINFLRDKQILTYRYTPKTKNFPNGSLFPDESFFTYNFWNNYMMWLGQLKKDDKNFYDFIMKRINNDKKELEIKKIELETELKIVEEKLEDKKTEDTLGTKVNPWNKISEAKKGEYFKRGDKVCQKKT